MLEREPSAGLIPLSTAVGGGFAAIKMDHQSVKVFVPLDATETADRTRAGGSIPSFSSSGLLIVLLESLEWKLSPSPWRPNSLYLSIEETS